MSTILDAIKICASYDTKEVLEDATLTVRKNDFIGFIGPNGGGKTTLVKVIGGLVKPTSGTLKYYRNGKKTSSIRIGYLPQKFQPDKQFPIRVKEVVSSGLIKSHFFRLNKQHNKKTEEILELLNLKGLSNKAISEISGGEVQRALLGRAIISEPELLLLDEPDTYLDQSSEKLLYQTLNELNSKMAIILVSHDLGTISSYVKTIACINKHLHYHASNEITDDMLESYQCPVELITHGKVPHRVLKDHIHE